MTDTPDTASEDTPKTTQHKLLAPHKHAGHWQPVGATLALTAAQVKRLRADKKIK